MSLNTLIVYFDYKSPYAYLAVEDARGLAASWTPALTSLISDRCDSLSPSD